MKGVLVCKTCLITNVKMFHLDNLANAYSDLTGLQCDDTTTEYVCYQCAALLLKFQQFRTKCLRANQVISEFAGKYYEITENVINTIDRKLYNLESTIFKFVIKENVFNEIYNESNPINFDKDENKHSEKYIKIEIDEVIAASEIKKEVELYDDKDQAVSDDNESSHLEDDIGLNKEPITLVRKETKGENEKNKKKSGPSRKKLDYSFMDEHITVAKLTQEEAKNEVLLRKESNNYKSNPYKCDLCYRGYGVLQTYENHMKKHNKENGEKECEYCHIRFSKQNHKQQHILKCHTMKFCCKKCPYTCFDSHQAKLHINLHKGTKYICKECGKSFSMPNSLLSHQHFKHTAEYVCAMCGSTFGKERGLQIHINLIHKQDTNDQKGPLCEECDVHFATETAWKRHLVLSSKHTVSNGCEVCGETYESEDALKKHAKVHARKSNITKLKPKNINSIYNCTMCEKVLVGKREYYAHMRTVHFKVTAKLETSDTIIRKDHSTVAPKLEDNVDPNCLQYVCEVCGKKFKAKSFLAYHQRLHTGERPYSCADCGRSYKMRSQLKTHLEKHSASQHKCHLCEKTFVYQNSLYKHIKKHLGIRPYKCNICEKAFATPCEVKYHNRYTHQKVPWPKRDRSKRIKSASEFSPMTS